jgi:hypothetical protein
MESLFNIMMKANYNKDKCWILVYNEESLRNR